MLALALQWIKEIEAATSLKDLINPKSIAGKNFPDYEELDLMMAAEMRRCYDKYPHFQKKIRVEERRAQKDNRFLRGSQIAYLIYEITERGAVTKGEGQNSYTERKTGECFQRKTIGSCSRRATGDRESMRKEVGDARRSRLEQASSSVAGKMQKIVVWDILPCVVVTSLETDAFMAIVAYFDMLMVRRNPARDREQKVLKEQLLLLGEKKVQGCESQNSDPKI